MQSGAFPIMFGNTSTKIIEDKEATMSNLRLLLHSTKKALLGDPYFGTNIKKLIYEQNNTVLRDLVIDEIYEAILTFIPQLSIQRKDITVTSDLYNIYVQVKALNMLDYNMDNYNLQLLNIEEVQ